MTAPPSHARASAPAAERPWWVRALTGQESGLILVIAALGVALTIFGGTKPKPFTQVLSADASVVVRGDDGAETPIADWPAGAPAPAVVVRSGGATRTYADPIEPGRWRIVESAGGRELQGRLTANRFLDVQNLVLVAKDASFIAIMAVGMTTVIIIAGIDLSVGSIYALSAMAGALVLSSLERQTSLAVALPAGVLTTCAVGALCGLANGSMIVFLRVPAFVITLGTLAIYRGLTFVIPKELRQSQSISGFPESFTTGFFKAELGGVYPVPVIVMLIVGVIGAFILTRTVLGRQAFAIGGNETAARYAGIPVGRVKIIVYTVMGALAGLSGAVYLGYLGAAETNAGSAYELKVIAATVIGGTSLTGGRGSALGAVLGAIVIQLIDNAMIILDIPQDWTLLVMGSAIIIAVVIDQTKQRLGSSHRA